MSVSVRAVLFGDGEPGAALGSGWSGIEGVPGLAPAAGKGLEHEVGTALSNLLDIDLGQLLLGGWRRHRALAAAAQYTHEHPGTTELVHLATHRIATGYRPSVEIALNGTRIATVHFELTTAFELTDIAGTVRRGRLVQLHSGRCRVTVGLACAGRELARRSADLDLDVVLPLGSGVPLLTDEPVAPAPRVP
jgi:hypothetical protein